MNDDTPFFGAELASAYLDNEVTPDERAQVEASPELRAQVADLDRLRATMGTLTPLADGARESALAAAMAAFDQLGDVADPAAAAASPVTPAAAAPARVISLAARRQRMYRIVTGVAAAAVLTVGGIAALQRSGSDEKMSATTSADAKIAAAPADAATAMAPAETAAPADTVAAAETATASADTTAPADSSTLQGAPASEADTAAGNASAVVPQLANAQELADYAAVNAAIIPLAPTPSSERIVAPPPCGAAVGDGTVIGEIVYAGEPALAVRLGNGHVIAVSSNTCTVLAEVVSP